MWVRVALSIEMKAQKKEKESSRQVGENDNNRITIFVYNSAAVQRSVA